MSDIEAHYNNVSQAWQYVMGDNQHYGLYKTGQENLNQASENLIDEMLDYYPVQTNTHILDVGCGTGGPAFYLHKKLNAKVTGIALAESEIKQANENKKSIGSLEAIKFIQADGQNNKLADNTFNLVVMMESALLVPNKELLFSENYRVLKSKGSFILCDQIKIKPMPPAEIYKNGKRIEALQTAFGNAQTVTLDDYAKLMENAGFQNIEKIDVSEKVKKSPAAWKKNAILHQTQILKNISQNSFDQFIIACETLEDFMLKGFLGYCIIKGEKI
jgi:ubiquinone/menaquinone biosynthesis C-methylase UbiE